MFLKAKLPARLKFRGHPEWTLRTWTESVSRQMAVVQSGESTIPAGEIFKNDEVALEIDLPERHPFSPRCLRCEGRVGFVSGMIQSGIRLGMIVDRMHFRTAETDLVNERSFITHREATRNARKTR